MEKTVSICLILGGLALISFFLLRSAHTKLCEIKLIYDNPILTVPVAIVSKTENKATFTQTAIISTFGLLLGNTPIMWGVGGRHGVRLLEARIDSLYITLLMGKSVPETQIKLLHGLQDTDADLLHQITQQLQYETGVIAQLEGWN